MNVAGIIAEYNPFHSGHLYHLQKTKQLFGADYLIKPYQKKLPKSPLPSRRPTVNL